MSKDFKWPYQEDVIGCRVEYARIMSETGYMPDDKRQEMRGAYHIGCNRSPVESWEIYSVRRFNTAVEAKITDGEGRRRALYDTATKATWDVYNANTPVDVLDRIMEKHSLGTKRRAIITAKQHNPERKRRGLPEIVLEMLYTGTYGR